MLSPTDPQVTRSDLTFEQNAKHDKQKYMDANKSKQHSVPNSKYSKFILYFIYLLTLAAPLPIFSTASNVDSSSFFSSATGSATNADSSAMRSEHCLVTTPVDGVVNAELVEKRDARVKIASLVIIVDLRFRLCCCALCLIIVNSLRMLQDAIIIYAFVSMFHTNKIFVSSLRKP